MGVAAGGGFPQWNCACPNCRGVREGTVAARSLFQSSLAISPGGDDWYLINAGPDVRMQIESFSKLHAGPGIRETPLAGVLLTDAELDHTIGLLSLREGSNLTLYGTKTVRKSLQSEFPVLPMLKNYCSWQWQDLDPYSRQQVGEDLERTTVEAIPVSRKPPLYAQERDDDSENIWEVGFLLRNEYTGNTLAYFPTLDALTPAIENVLQEADILMVDGTFWSENELVETGATERGAKEMGHMPIGGMDGTLEKLNTYPSKRKVLIHINNSNPILRADSHERHNLEKSGFEVAYDGMELEV